MNRLVRTAIAVVVLLGAAAPFGQAQKQELTAEEILARHLESIGTASARAAAQSRVVQGNVRMDMTVGSAVHSEGKALIASHGRQLILRMQFPDGGYPNEDFQSDGNDVRIALISPGQRSHLGEWLFRENALLRESLLGGSLPTSWSLLDLKARQAKLKYQGLKKIDGRELYDLAYSPKKGDSSLSIHLFFEPETFRHVKSTYSILVSADMANLRNQPRGVERGHAQDQTEMTYRLEEAFSDFRTVDGISLPAHWRLQFSQEAEKTMSMTFDFTFADFKHNTVVD